LFGQPESQEAINRIVKSFFIVLLLLTGFGEVAMGNLLDSDIAIKGYDTVAYFTTGKALKGNESFTFKWHDMTWYFLTKENRDLFATNPEKYAPQYDGYCAWAMTEARKAQTDPEIWEIVNRKLYLQCSQASYKKWSSDIPGNIKKADMNWLKFISKN
jgi:YHS domain-containing protein